MTRITHMLTLHVCLTLACCSCWVRHEPNRDLRLEEYFFGRLLHWRGNPNSAKHREAIAHSVSNSTAKGIGYVLKQLRKVWGTAADFHMLESYSSLVAEVADTLGRERQAHQQQPASPAAGTPQLLAMIPGRVSLLTVSPVLHGVQLQSLLPGRMMGAPNAPAVMGHEWLVEQHGIKVEKLGKASVSCCGCFGCCHGYSMTITITSELGLRCGRRQPAPVCSKKTVSSATTDSCAATVHSCSKPRQHLYTAMFLPSAGHAHLSTSANRRCSNL